MKKYLLTAYSILIYCTAAMCQQKSSIQGIVKDTAVNQPLADATITVLLAADSSLVTFSRTGSNGFFMIRNIAPGQYRLLITHVGYRNINRPFTLTGGMPAIDFGTMPVTSQSTLLAAVTIVQEKPPVVIKNDTIEFNAGSFKTKPNAVVEDLLKKLPGVQVDKDGKIKSNGQEIKKVLVDGKEFFGNDPKTATRNLPADAIDKVQVFDRKSDQSRFTGFDDGNSEKTINLTIKPDRKNGVFGKATAGAGDKGLYESKFNLNSFSGEKQLSAIGMLNNTNKQGFSFLDILNFSGGLPGAPGGAMLNMNNTGVPVQGSGNNEGVTTTRAGGLNYNDSWQKKTDWMSSYFYNNLQTGIAENVRQQWLLPGNNFVTTRQNNSTNSNESHRLNITADYKIDTANSVRLTSSINRQQSGYSISSRYNSKLADSSLLNDGYTGSFITGSGYTWNNTALLRHRFRKKGRTFSASLSFNTNNSNSNGGVQSQNNYYLPSGTLQQSDTINQVNTQSSKSTSYGMVFSYTEPLSRKSLLQLNYNFNAAHSTSDRTTFDFDKLTGKHTALNDLLSNEFLNNYRYNRPGINWQVQQKKYSFTVGAAVQEASLNNRFHLAAQDSSIRRAFTNLLPNANLQYSINQYQHVHFVYSTFTRQPSVTQLQPLADNADPLNVRVGNPDLKQEYYHQLQADYISFDPYRHTSFFGTLSAFLTNNKIADADQLNAQGQRITRPVNVNGIYTVNLSTSWGFPVRKIKSKINLNSFINQSHNASFINSQKNNINSWNASQEITWNYTFKELFDLGAGTEVSYNNVRYTLQSQQNTTYWNQHYTAEANVYLPKGFSIASDVDYTTRSGLSQGYNLSACLWNAGIAKQLFKNKKAELRLQVYDILNQNIGVSRSSNQNYIEDKSYNVLKRYVQLSFTYNISRFAGKNIAAPSRKENIQVIRSK